MSRSETLSEIAVADTIYRYLIDREKGRVGLIAFPTSMAGQLVGKLTCTLGEVKNRADLIVYWGSNPVETHPRHLTKFSLTPKGTFVPGGRKDRTMLLVDVRDTLTARRVRPRAATATTLMTR